MVEKKADASRENESTNVAKHSETPYKVVEEGERRTLVMDYSSSAFMPSLPDSPIIMRDVVMKLLEIRNIDKIILIQKQEYVYDLDQTEMLYGVANLYKKLVREKGLISPSEKGILAHELSTKYEELRRIIMYLLVTDPVAAYIELRRMVRHEEIAVAKPSVSVPAENRRKFIELIKEIVADIEKLTIIQIAKPKLPEYKLGMRTIYELMLAPTIRPYFIYTKLVTKYPTGGEQIDSYSLNENTDVTIFKVPGEIRPVYYIIPPEFKLNEDIYELLGTAREIIAKHKPTREEFMSPERTREVFYEVEKDLLDELSKKKKIKLSSNERANLVRILLRYTIGFGMIEVLLFDPKVQDIVVNAPAGGSPIYITHAEYGECKTNITVTPREVEGWATKLRMISGRPLDEANPVLDTSIVLPAARARVAAIQRPLSHRGLAFAFRRHRSKPWTLPLFIQNGMVSSLAAGLFSFIIDGGRTLLVAGTRSSGKTSLLSSLLVEIMRKDRIITVEDTLELPVEALRKLEYDIESMKVKSVITGGEGELSAEQGIRTSLRLGDSCLIVGEIRSTEAKALYEAMRVGALAHTVAGTIHGDSPYSVFDRVVNDLNVPITSFKATDFIAVANPVKSASGMHSLKRMVQLAEVRKFWSKDPLDEGGFVDLLTYSPKDDKLKPTNSLLEGESEILKSIAGRVKEWAGSWPSVWENILLRSRLKQELVDAAVQIKNMDLLEAPFVVQSNDKFHMISEEVQEEIGVTDPKRVYDEWMDWLKKSIKRRKI